jgi:hypothetical protein
VHADDQLTLQQRRLAVPQKEFIERHTTLAASAGEPELGAQCHEHGSRIPDGRRGCEISAQGGPVTNQARRKKG